MHLVDIPGHLQTSEQIPVFSAAIQVTQYRKHDQLPPGYFIQVTCQDWIL